MHHFMVAAIDAMLKHLTSDQDCVRPFTPLPDLPWPPPHHDLHQRAMARSPFVEALLFFFAFSFAR
jgi:hypothetical protein